MGNEKSLFTGQTIQRQKENGQKDKQRSTNQYTDDISKRKRRFSVMKRRNKRQIYHNCDISFLI